jgi:hypothetical protein
LDLVRSALPDPQEEKTWEQFNLLEIDASDRRRSP